MRCGTATDDALNLIDEAASTYNWPSALYQAAGMFGNPYPMIKGRPVITVEQLPTVGTQNDLVLVDWTQYLFLYRQMTNTEADVEIGAGFPGDIAERMMSEHFKFDLDEVPLRVKLRGDGRLIWPAKLTNNNGVQVGPCVVLQGR